MINKNRNYGKDNNDNVIRATEKTKTGKGVNKTVDKTITKSDGTKVIKKKDKLSDDDK